MSGKDKLIDNLIKVAVLGINRTRRVYEALNPNDSKNKKATRRSFTKKLNARAKARYRKAKKNY